MMTRRTLLASLAAAPARPNVVLLVADDLRHDALGCYGDPVARTPNLDRLAGQGVLFTRASCAHPLCFPSRAEILTGCSGFRNGAYASGNIRNDVPRWAGVMRESGYRTWYSGKWHNNGRPKDHGYERTSGLYTGAGGRWAKPGVDWLGRQITGYKGWIFESGDGKPEPERGVGLTPEISRVIADSAIEVIARSEAEPYFLHVNFTAPHDPLIMPPGYERMFDPAKIPVPRNFLAEHPFDHGNLKGRDEALWQWPRTADAVRQERAHYYAVLAHLDAQIGRVLSAIDSNTVVIFTADNGLAIGSHGLRGKQNLYEHSIGVPLLIRGPGIAAGFRAGAECYLRDLFPTVCDLTGAAAPPGLQATSLAPVLRRRARAVREESIGYYQDSQRMIRAGRWKYIWYPKARREQLFDLRRDPDEMHDLSGERSRVALRGSLRKRMLDSLAESGDPLARN